MHEKIQTVSASSTEEKLKNVIHSSAYILSIYPNLLDSIEGEGRDKINPQLFLR